MSALFYAYTINLAMKQVVPPCFIIAHENQAEFVKSLDFKGLALAAGQWWRILLHSIKPALQT
jgi:hypothetical protein